MAAYFAVLKVITALNYNCFLIFKTKSFLRRIYVNFCNLHAICTKFEYFHWPGWNFHMYRKSLLNYVPYMLSCATYPRTSRASCSTCYRAPRDLVPYVLSFPTCFVPYVARALRASSALHASCHTCSRVSRVLRALEPHASCALRVFRLLVPRTLRLLVLLVPHLLQVFQV